MFSTERSNAILNVLKQKKHVSVSFLASHVYASEVTIRRDLKRLEDLGLVHRTWGGVTLCESENRFVPLSIREISSSTVKDQIAKMAVAYIADGNTIFMDGSSTVMRMVRFFHEKQNLTVITNSLKTATLLCEKQIHVYCTGGELVPEALVCTGSFSEHMISSVTADLFFFSSQGLSANGMISDFSESETVQRQLMLRHSQEKYFLCDSSKLGKSFLFNAALL